jgi:hypothetical protein
VIFSLQQDKSRGQLKPVADVTLRSGLASPTKRALQTWAGATDQ